MSINDELRRWRERMDKELTNQNATALFSSFLDWLTASHATHNLVNALPPVEPLLVNPLVVVIPEQKAALGFHFVKLCSQGKELASLAHNEFPLTTFPNRWSEYLENLCSLYLWPFFDYLQTKLGKAQPSQSNKPSDVVFSLHGIKTRGRWQKDVVPLLSQAGLTPVLLDYGYFFAFQLLIPPSRRKKIDWFLDEYIRQCDRVKCDRPSIVAHSLGSYLVAEAISKYPQIRFDRIIFCGAIVQRHFPWSKFHANGQVSLVLNQYGGRDIWATVVAWFVSDAGQSGLRGFEEVSDYLVEQGYARFRHSDYFHDLNYKQNWIPFLRGQQLGQSPVQVAKKKNWRFRLTIATILIILVFALVCGVRAYLPKPFPSDTFGIMVLRMEGDDTAAKAQLRIFQRLDGEKSLGSMGRRCIVKRVPRQIDDSAGHDEGHEYARKIGEQWNASLVIWGTVANEREFYPRITVVKRSVPRAPLNFTLQEPLNLSAPKELVEECLSTIDLIVGYDDYIQGKYEPALTHFEAILNRAERHSLNLTDALLYAGNCHFRLGQDGKTQATHLRRDIEYLEEALKHIDTTDKVQVPKHSQILNNFGTVYSLLATGNRLENLNRAIEYYNQALTVRTRDEFQQDWALTQVNLGLAYSELPTRTKTENLMRAEDCFKQALTVFTPEKNRFFWAGIQNNLAVLYMHRPIQRNKDLDTAEGFLLEGLKAYLGEKLPLGLLGMIVNRGVVCLNRQRIDPRQDLSDAKEFFETALRECSEEKYSQIWADLQTNLGNLYANMLGNNRDAHLREAIKHFEAALRVQTQEELPSAWANTQRALGDTYSELEAGDRIEYQKCALAHYQCALRVYRSESFPDEWAAVQNGLGNLYSTLTWGSKQRNLQASIRYLEGALGIHSSNPDSDGWAMIQSNMSNVYSKLSLGGKNRNIDLAVEHGLAALKVFSKADSPRWWAVAQQNLGLAYSKQITGNRRKNLEAAMVCFNEALSVWNDEVFPKQWMACHKLLEETRRKIGSDTSPKLDQTPRILNRAS